MALGIVLVRCGIVRSQDSKVLKLDGVEETSLIYSNAGNLIIPIVTAILGKEWVIYTSAFLSVQLFLLWSHAKMKLCGEKGIDLKKILTNINMIAIFAGVLLFLRNRQISRRIKKHLWLSNRSWARDVHSFGILHSWGALAGKSCSAQASSIWLIAGAFRRTQSK